MKTAMRVPEPKMKDLNSSFPLFTGCLPMGRGGCLYSIRLWSISKLPEREAKL
jgi:hypothetical protein